MLLYLTGKGVNNIMERLLFLLNEIKNEKEQREKNNNYVYNEEDLLILREWLDSGEITLYDLTTKEYRLLGISLFAKNRQERHTLCSRFPNNLAKHKWIEQYRKQGDNISPRLLVQYLDDAIKKYGENESDKKEYLKIQKKRQTN